MKNPNDVKQAQEIKNQAVDKIINDFAQDLNLYEVDKTSLYFKSDKTMQESIDKYTYNFFKQRYDSQVKTNPYIARMPFEKFLDFDVPDDVFKRMIYVDGAENSPANLWMQTFNEDSNAMKQSALKEYKKVQGKLTGG